MPYKIRDFMVPIEDYVSINGEDTLADYFHALEEDRANKQSGESHRDAIVMENGELIGKVTIGDIYMALEPAYKSITEMNGQTSVLTAEYIAKVYKQHDLWSDPLEDLCKANAKLKVKNFMHRPKESEFIEADQSLDKAMHSYVMGVHQPLLVRDNGKVVGVLRYADVFEAIRELALACVK